MTPTPQTNPRRKRSPLWALALTVVALLALAGLALLAFRLTLGSGLGVRGTLKAFVNTAIAVIQSDSVRAQSQGEYTNIIFLHHSTGRNLIEQGNMRQLFTQAGYNFWDQDYNDVGMRNPDGQNTGFLYWLNSDNTDPWGLEELFSQPVYNLPLNTLSGLLQHEVIVLKSCFPNSHITSEEHFEGIRSHYMAIRRTINQHPDKLFILLTSPPLNPAETNAEAAARARRMNDWLLSDDFRGGTANLAVFDFFGLLAVNDPASAENNMLRPEYRQGSDSHPNQPANAAIGPLLVQFVIEAVEDFR